MNTHELMKIRHGRSIWHLGNECLYRLCEKYPDHKSPEIITAKIWLIGRSYAAAIERGRRKNGQDGDSFYEFEVVPNIQKSDLDIHLQKLRNFSDINDRNTCLILRTHKYLTDLFQKISGRKKRSLASKYLHFHCPSIYFLYDSRALRGLRVLMPDVKPKNIAGDFDKEYAKFFLKVYNLRKEIHANENILLSSRVIDNTLISIEDSRL